MLLKNEKSKLLIGVTRLIVFKMIMQEQESDKKKKRESIQYRQIYLKFVKL